MSGDDSLDHFWMVGHGHIDPVWRWTQDEGYQEVFATFRSALDRMKEFPEFKFVSSSAVFYEWVQQGDPKMFAEIQQRVAEGRWNFLGGWWLEPDVNAPLGESLVRQGLYGQRYFQKAFGSKASIGFNPDSFGHPWTLPQILRGQELTSYYFMRPMLHENEKVPAPVFQWQGPDGSKILTVQILTSYCCYTQEELETRVGHYLERFGKYLPEVKDYALFFGVGNHGGGPTIAMIKIIEELRKSKYPTMNYGTAQEYVELLEERQAKLPVFDEELQHHAPGCYTACSAVKRWNRQAEVALLRAEKAAALSEMLTGSAFPAEALREAWKKVLFNQFHDIMAGSSTPECYVDAQHDYGYAMSAAREVTTRSLHFIAQGIQTADATRPESSPFVVFNPCSWDVCEPMEYEAERLARDRMPKPVLRDAAGNAVAYQEIPTSAVKVWERVRIVFQAQAPALGYQLYRLDFSGTEQPPAPASAAKATANTLENERVRVTFDVASGDMVSYFDKKNGRELLSGPAGMIVLDDPTDTWGHGAQRYDKVIGRFGGATMIVREEGPLRARLEVRTSYGASTIVQDYSLHAGSAALDCKVSIDWHEKLRMLKMALPTVLAEGELTASIPYGHVRREMKGLEDPVQTWLDLSGRDAKGEFGLALLQDCKGGYSAERGELRLSILRSPVWSHHEPAVVEEKDGYRAMEQGAGEFCYRLLPHEGDWREGDVARRAESFLHAPVALVTSNHAGTLPTSGSLARTTMPNVSVSVAKHAEDGKGLILRLVELCGQEASGKLFIDSLGREVDVTLRPCEIKTLRLALRGKSRPKWVNLLEE